MKSLSNGLDKVIKLIFGLFAAASVLTAFKTPNFSFLPFWGKFLGLLLVIGLIILLLQPKIYQRFKNFVLPKRYLALVLGLLFVYQLLFYWQLTILSGWDPGVIIQNAGGAFSQAYFSWNYNNTFLLLIEHGIYRLAIDTGLMPTILKALLVANALVLDLAVLGMYFIGKRLKDAHFGTVLFSLGLLFWGLSPWILEFYSDTLGLLAVVGLSLLALKISQATAHGPRSLWTILYTLLSIASYLLKPTTLIISMAFVIILMLHALKQRLNWRQFLVGLLYTIGALSIFVIGNQMYTHYVYHNLTFTVEGKAYKLDPQLKTPPSHFIAMGLAGIGGYNDADPIATHNVKTYQARDAMNRRKIRQRLHNYGVVGYLKFLRVKFNNNIANGNFVWDGDINFNHKQLHYPINLISRLSAAFNLIDGRFRNPMRWLNQVTWIILLSFSFMSIFVKPTEKFNFLRLNQLIILGMQIYLLIFEGGTSRYVFMWLPCFVITGLYGYHFSQTALKNWRTKPHHWRFSKNQT